MKRPILSYRSTKRLPQTTPHSGLGIASFSIACLATVLILAMWAGDRWRFLSRHADAVLFLVAGVLTVSAALIGFIGLLDAGVRRDFAFRGLLLALINFFVLALLPMFVTA